MFTNHVCICVCDMRVRVYVCMYVCMYVPDPRLDPLLISVRENFPVS